MKYVLDDITDMDNVAGMGTTIWDIIFLVSGVLFLMFCPR